MIGVGKVRSPLLATAPKILKVILVWTPKRKSYPIWLPSLANGHGLITSTTLAKGMASRENEARILALV